MNNYYIQARENLVYHVETTHRYHNYYVYNYTNTTLKLIFWQSFVNQREVVPHRLLYVLVR